MKRKIKRERAHPRVWQSPEVELTGTKTVKKCQLILDTYSENYKFDIDNLIQNTLFLFNVLDEYVVHANTFRKNI